MRGWRKVVDGLCVMSDNRWHAIGGVQEVIYEKRAMMSERQEESAPLSITTRVCSEVPEEMFVRAQAASNTRGWLS